MIEAAGHTGEKFGILGHRSNSPTGHLHDFAGIRPSIPIPINGLNNIINAAGAATGALTQLSDSDRIQLMKMVNQLNEAQKIKLASASGGKNSNGPCLLCDTEKYSPTL